MRAAKIQGRKSPLDRIAGVPKRNVGTKALPP